LCGGAVELDEEGKKAIQENYVNHTCDGNAWYIVRPLSLSQSFRRLLIAPTTCRAAQSDNELVALRDIKKGEEIAYDYALTECHSEFKLNCRCGTSQVVWPFSSSHHHAIAPRTSSHDAFVGWGWGRSAAVR
jgi:hypothetical protein